MAFDPHEAVEFLAQVTDAESTNRAEALRDLRFRFGDQWSPTDMQSRQLSGRPCLTINEVDSYCRQVANNQRQQRPRIKVHPVDSVADPKIADVLTGVMRHIEVNSDADNAYDIGFDYAITMGVGYWRVVADYVREDSFDQDIFIKPVENPFSVYFDNNSWLPDGSDAERCLIADMMSKAAFKRQFPGAQEIGFTANAMGDSTAQWVSKDDIRIAEYFNIERERAKLVMLSDKTITWADKMPPMEVLRKEGISVIGDRDSFRRTVEWRKITAFEVLESRRLAGRFIPVIPVYGNQIVVDGKRKRFGLVRNAIDPQIMSNYWQTAITESIALAPKAKWLIAEGQDEGHENEWAKANVSPVPVLRYKQTDIDGREAPRPDRLQPEPPPSGMIEAAMAASSNLQKVMGMFDPAIRTSGNRSGKAIRAEQMQSDNSNFQYYDNLTRSIKHTARIILDMIPATLDTERVTRIIGEDDKPDMVTLNQAQSKVDENGQPMVDAEGKAIQTILNDVTVGTYDVVMDTGPGFNSRRQEAVEAFMAMLGTPLGEKLANVADDVIMRQMDAPGADIIADRLAAANPLAQIDDKSDVPPQAQMMIKQLQKQLQQAQGQLQAATQEIKLKTGIEQVRQDAETKREMMRQTVKAHDIETEDRGWQRDVAERSATHRHDTEVRALSAQNVEELRGMVQLMLKRLDTTQFERQAEREDAQAALKANETEPITFAG